MQTKMLHELLLLAKEGKKFHARLQGEQGWVDESNFNGSGWSYQGVTLPWEYKPRAESVLQEKYEQLFGLLEMAVLYRDMAFPEEHEGYVEWSQMLDEVIKEGKVEANV